MVNAKKEIVFHEKQIAILQMLIDLDNRISRSKQNIKMVKDEMAKKLNDSDRMDITIDKPNIKVTTSTK